MIGYASIKDISIKSFSSKNINSLIDINPFPKKEDAFNFDLLIKSQFPTCPQRITLTYCAWLTQKSINFVHTKHIVHEVL